jgi:hypothetical protein
MKTGNYSDFFIWKDGKADKEPNNWVNSNHDFCSPVLKFSYFAEEYFEWTSMVI